MLRRVMIVLVAVAFVSSSLLFMTSCAKQTVKKEEVTQPATTPKAAVPSPTEDKEAMERAEKERQARLAELEKSQRIRNEIRAFEAESIYFDFDKSDLKPEARAMLVKKADWLRTNTDYSVRIEGNCDERGTIEYNLALGERRALAAWKFLNALGISGDRMSTISYGEERPVDPGHNATAWAKNRRDDFKLMK